MKKLLIVVMACYGLNARSQTNESKNFLYLYSDSTIYAQRIRLGPDFTGSWALRVDSRRMPTKEVKFFQDNNGFYANTKNLNFSGASSFAERIIDGKINLYQQVFYEDVPYEGDDHRFSGVRREVVNTRMFFNKGFSDLKRVNYDNLSLAMSDNQQSLDLLKSYRKSMNAGTAMYVAAGATALGCIATVLSDNSFNNNYTGTYILLGATFGFGLGGYLIKESGKRNIRRAIENYNR